MGKTTGLRALAFAAIPAPVRITLGAEDTAAILKGIKGRLIPALKKAGMALEPKITYPGNHNWFWRVREEHFSDVTAFLDGHLK